MKFERVRIFEFTETEKKYPSLNKYHIEFVYLQTKHGDLMRKLFGDTLCVKHSRHVDDRFVYLPQSYRDFLRCLKETQTNENGEVIINLMNVGPLLAQPLLHSRQNKHLSRKERKLCFLEDDEAVVTGEELVKFACEYLKDDYLEEEKARVKKEKFLRDCSEVLDELRESSEQSQM
ncbi:MAG: hypothetical protein IJW24_01310 [Clostridia bacterium]|nr:hypothetical protein [Clostridia bacterium]